MVINPEQLLPQGLQKEVAEKLKTAVEKPEPTEADLDRIKLQAEAEISTDENRVLESAQRRVEQASGASGLSPDKTQAIFAAGGFAQRIKNVKESIVALAQSAKDRIKGLSSIEASDYSDGKMGEQELKKIEGYIDQAVTQNYTENQLPPEGIEATNQLLGDYALKLLEAAKRPGSSPELSERAEAALLKIYNSATYENSDERNKMPYIRSFSGTYKKAMSHIYKALSEQTLIRSGIKKESKKIKEAEAKYAQKTPKQDRIHTATEAGVKKKVSDIDKDTAAGANRLFEKILKSYNLQPKEFVEAWKKASHTLNEGGDFMARDSLINMERMRSLEQIRPGSASALSKEFGIKFFGRYKEDTLVEQYEQKDDAEKPYGILACAYDDHNGVFMCGDDEVTEFAAKLNGKYNLRIIEVDGKADLSQRTNDLDKRYGAKQKIAFAVISGHGQKDSIQFGKNVWWKSLLRQEQDGLFESKDLVWIKSMKDKFAESPWLIFNSCSTGKVDGIAQKTSAAMEGGSLGPVLPSVGMMHDSMPVFQGDKIVRFEDTSKQLNVYERGKKLN